MTGLGQIFITAIVGVAGNTPHHCPLFLTMLLHPALGMGGCAHHGQLRHHGHHLRAHILINGMGMNVIAANMFRSHLRHRGRHHAPVAPGGLRGRGHCQVQPHEDRLQRQPSGHCGLHRALYIFAFNNAMLFTDTNVFEVAQVCLTSCIGMFGSCRRH